MESKAIKSTVLLLFSVIVVMAILIAGNKSLVATLLAYRSRELQGNLFTISKKNLFNSILWAIGASVAFYLITRLIPGFSIGLPRLTQTISETVRSIVIIGFAPIVESVFFQSVVYALIYNLDRKFALVGQAGAFSLAHVAAYISGFYSYPSFTQGYTAIGANIGSFIAAFVFALVGMYILRQKTVNNLVFIIIFHAVVNTILLLSFVILFL